jgi:cell wall-associated NlpC family hydrolase
MSFAVSAFTQHRASRRRLAVLLTLGALPGCAGAPIRLDVSPSRGPTVRATLGPLDVAGRLGRGGIGLGVSRGTPVAGGGWNAPHVAPSASAARVLATADRYLGTRYRYGGESPAEGFDCSGFVQFVFGRNGVELPRTSYQQVTAGRPAHRDIAALRPGDLMFFASEGRRIDHVAIYAGGGRVIHATSGAGSVRYDDLDTDRGEWLLRRFVASRRVLRGGRET